MHGAVKKLLLYIMPQSEETAEKQSRWHFWVWKGVQNHLLWDSSELQWEPHIETLVLVRTFLGLADLLKLLQERIDDSSMRSQKNPAQYLKNYTTRLAQFRSFGTFGKIFYGLIRQMFNFLFESRYIWHKTNKAFHKRNITSPTRWWSCKGLGLFLLQDLHDLPTLMKSWILLLTRRMSWFNPWITLLLCSSTMIWKLHLCRA